MPEYLAPGVFIEEVSFRSKSIEGVGTSTTAFAGPTSRGPLHFPADRSLDAGMSYAPVIGAPEVLVSFADFERLYGGFAKLSWHADAGARDRVNYTAHAVRAFFENGGARLYFARTFIPGATPGVAASDAFAGARLRARFPGSGGNGTVTVRERRSPVGIAAANAAPDGSLLRIGADGMIAGPARVLGGVLGGATSFAIAPGGTLTVQVVANGGAPSTHTATVAATAARAVAPTALVFPLDLTAGAAVLPVRVDGLAQTITVPAAAYAAPNDLLIVINAQLRRASAVLGTGGDAGKLILIADHQGSTATLVASRCDVLGFDADSTGTPGTGNVRDCDAISIAELNALLAAATPTAAPVTAALSDDRLVLSTTATGETTTLTVIGTALTSAHAGLLLPTTAAIGSAGTTPVYYVKVPGSGWRTTESGGTAPADFANAALVQLSLEVADAAGQLTVFDDVGLHSAHPRWLGTLLARTPAKLSDALSNLVWFDAGGTPSAIALRAALLGSLGVQTHALTGGDDGVPAGAATAVAGGVNYGQALAVLAQVADISIVAAPAAAAQSEAAEVRNALISHADALRYRFAVLDTPRDQMPGQARAIRGSMDSTRAGLYYPWVVVPNPLARPGSAEPSEIALPPSGFLCGVYARTDIERGVWKAPANEVIRGILRFERDIPTGVNEVLNPEGVNCLRAMPGRGLRVWGARTISSDPEWKYVPVRRYFIYLERSIDVSTQWAVFEPNGEALWANIRETVSAFLFNEWRSGALLGTKPEEAFFVRCDRSTMTQADLDTGRLICLVGVAAIKPAEFVIFRIGQKTAEARS